MQGCKQSCHEYKPKRNATRTNEIEKYEKSGEAGRRSQCLSHAKRALYHLSYIPKLLYIVIFLIPDIPH